VSKDVATATVTKPADDVVGNGPTAEPPVDAGDAGYSKDLKARHINMIAIGGAIGTGLFLGAGGRLHDAGPALALAYLVCGVFAFFVVRALGELVVYRPSSGSFVSYAREFLGEKGAYVAGWMYFVNWSTTGIADITAVALYTHYWSMFSDVPQWVLALAALAVVLVVNLISVKYFGEMEFWFAIIKVATLVAFMLVGIFLLVSRHEVGGTTPGLSVITDNGGFLPHGVLPVVLVMQGVVFATPPWNWSAPRPARPPSPRRSCPARSTRSCGASASSTSAR
jgi:L-asparagine permease